jgi:hypothetical protein
MGLFQNQGSLWGVNNNGSKGLGMRNFSEEEFGRIFASQKPGFSGFRFAPFFALRAKNAARPYNPLRGPETFYLRLVQEPRGSLPSPTEFAAYSGKFLVFFGKVVQKLMFLNNSILTLLTRNAPGKLPGRKEIIDRLLFFMMPFQEFRPRGGKNNEE